MNMHIIVGQKMKKEEDIKSVEGTILLSKRKSLRKK